MSEPLLELKKLTRRYGAFEALRGIDLTLPPGRIGLLGPNGAGKSTLLKILMGLLSPTSGEGKMLGIPLITGGDDEGNWELRRRIGFMSEADALIPGLRGVDYVALAGELYGMPRRDAQRRAHEVLTYLELEDARYRRLEEYSTGMKQRLKLAQALVHDPPVLLLDEPTSGLDPAGRDAMLRLLRELGVEHGKSMIISTHLLADVETVCERLVIVYAGQVRGFGTIDELGIGRQNRYRLQIEGDADAYLADLRVEGAEILSHNDRGELRVVVPSEWVTRSFFAIAENRGVLVRSLMRDEESLEEMFFRLIKER